MSGPIEDLSQRLGRRSALRLACAAAVTGVLWSIAANLLQGSVEQLACMASDCAVMPTEATYRKTAAGLVLAVLGLLVAVKWGIPAVRGAFLNSVAVVRRNRQARPARALVLTLSDLRRPDEIALARSALEHAKATTDKASRTRVLTELCDAHGAWKAWRWQQPLRLLSHNKDRLDVMAFVLTREAAPQFVEYFRPLLQHLKPGMRILPEQDRDAETVDHSDYNEVTMAIDRACGAALASLHPGVGDLCIDITSGTKAWSAAATVKTLNSAAVFSYVETEPPFDVVTYDASLTA